MKKLGAILLTSVMMVASTGQADEKLGVFLKHCAWGTGLGAAAGTLSLAFEDKPSEHTVNIARGASLGLYGGILYGLVKASKPQPVAPAAREWGIGPGLREGDEASLWLTQRF